MLKIKVYSKDKIFSFNNDAKGIRDFIYLLNRKLKENNIEITITSTYEKVSD